MIVEDFSTIRDEIFDALNDVGLINIDGSDVTNIQWLQRIYQQYDKVYNVNVAPTFNTIDLQGCVTIRKRNYDLPIEGLNPVEIGKILVSPLEFIRVEITPGIADRVIHEGTVYSVSRISRLACSYTGGSGNGYIGDSSFLYAITLKEAPFAAQSVEYQDEQEPNYTIDASKPVEEADASGINDEIFENTPALMKGIVVGEYEITNAFNDLIKVSVGTFDGAILTLSSGTYTPAEMVAELNIQIVSVLGTTHLSAFYRDDKVGIETVAVGVNATFELKYVGANPYSDFGWRIGTYTGKHELALAPSSYYSDGDPLYASG